MDFLDDIKTVADKELMLSEIDAAKRRDYDLIRPSILDYLKSINNYDDLVKDLKKLGVVKITIAVPLTIGLLNSIDDFFVKRLKKKFLFDISVDEKIIGGIRIIFDGKYADYSVLKTITT